MRRGNRAGIREMRKRTAGGKSTTRWRLSFWRFSIGFRIITALFHKTKRHLRVSFYFVVKAEGLEPRNSKVPALLTVNSPVDCLRIELIIKPLPKKAPNFRCFFPLFMLFYGDFTCFFHIDKITAHGLFRTPQNRGRFFVK